jgi:hypothetical protein
MVFTGKIDDGFDETWLRGVLGVGVRKTRNAQYELVAA